jgi:hypothetical protein
MRIGGIRQIPLAPTLQRGLEQIAGPRLSMNALAIFLRNKFQKRLEG